MFWNMESPRQLDIGGQAEFGYPSNSHVMIPKQLRCWKAEDTWGKWLWKTETVFQPYSNSVVRSAYWHVFNSSSFSAWPTDYQISDQTFYFPVFPYGIQTQAKEEPAWEEYKGRASWPCPAPCHGTVPLGCAACSQPLTAYNCLIRLKELWNTSQDRKIGGWRLLKVRAQDLNAIPVSIAPGTQTQQLSSLDTKDNCLQTILIITFYLCLPGKTVLAGKVMCLDLTHGGWFPASGDEQLPVQISACNPNNLHLASQLLTWISPSVI